MRNSKLGTKKQKISKPFQGKNTDDPILLAKTIAQLAKALNKIYDVNWPTDFSQSKNQYLKKMWELEIVVRKGGEAGDPPSLLYKAKSTSDFRFNDILGGRVLIEIHQKPSPEGIKGGKEKVNGKVKFRESSRRR